EAAQLELDRAEGDLVVAQAQAAAQQHVLDAADDLYRKRRAEVVSAPPGSMMWSLIESPGNFVRPGAPAATWIDCRVMLVDVPVADVEVALLKVGASADVVLEGERKAREGTVLLLRGSASTLGSNDLAAIAKGRAPGVGQAILTLNAEPAEAE